MPEVEDILLFLTALADVMLIESQLHPPMSLPLSLVHSSSSDYPSSDIRTRERSHNAFSLLLCVLKPVSQGLGSGVTMSTLSSNL